MTEQTTENKESNPSTDELLKEATAYNLALTSRDQILMQNLVTCLGKTFEATVNIDPDTAYDVIQDLAKKFDEDNKNHAIANIKMNVDNALKSIDDAAEAHKNIMKDKCGEQEKVD